MHNVEKSCGVSDCNILKCCFAIFNINYKEDKIRLYNSLKGTLMQIWKSANIFVFIWKYVEDFTLKHILYFEICARKACEKFVYRHSGTIEYAKN